MKDMKIQDVMSTKLITLHPKDKIQRAKDVFAEFNIHHIPIVVMNKLVGILSQGDILYLESVAKNSFDRFLQSKLFEINAVEEVMSKQLFIMSLQSSLDEVLSLMINHKINAIPIVDNDELVGLITSYDILKLVSEQLK